MKIKLHELENMILELEKLTTKMLPIKVAYALSKNHKALVEECKNLYEQRKKVLEQNCSKDEDGNPILNEETNEYVYESDQIKADTLNTYRELLQTEVDVAIMNIDIEELGKCDTDKFDSLTVEDMMRIEKMIK